MTQTMKDLAKEILCWLLSTSARKKASSLAFHIVS